MNKSTGPPPPPPFSWCHEPSSFSSLPDEIAANCLARVSRSQYGSISSVSKGFYSLLSSPEIYAARSQIGAAEPRLYLRCESLNTDTTRSHRWYNLMSQNLISNCDGDVFISVDGSEIKIKSELMRLVPVKDSSFHLCAPRLKEASLAVGSEIYQFGGINNKDKPSRSVCVLDCRSHTQRRVPDMRVAREGAKACLLDGRIYVVGGCSEKECWGEVFDIKSQTWNKEELVPSPSGEDEFDCKFEVFVLGAKIYVITERNKYAYDPKQGKWLLLDTVFARLKSILEIGTVWCVLDDILFKEFSDDLFWFDVSCGKWLIVEGLEDLLSDAKVNCCYRMIQLVNYGGKLVIVWVVLPDVIYRRSKPPFIPEERTWFAVIRLEKRLTSSGLAISGEIEQLKYLVHGSCNPLTCLSVSL